jgi:hypothetical protein
MSDPTEYLGGIVDRISVTRYQIPGRNDHVYGDAFRNQIAHVFGRRTEGRVGVYRYQPISRIAHVRRATVYEDHMIVPVFIQESAETVCHECHVGVGENTFQLAISILRYQVYDCVQVA